VYLLGECSYGSANEEEEEEGEEEDEEEEEEEDAIKSGSSAG
jgi:hypothetical protein